MPPAVETAVEELYSGAPENFVARRGELAKAARAAGDRDAATEIATLRRPSLSAWSVNRVARECPAVVEQLEEVGTRLRHAQSHLDAKALTDLRRERDALVERYVTAADQMAAKADRALGPSPQQEVRDTVIAALASVEATQAVVSGHLTRALSYSGFGEVDVSDAVAVPVPSREETSADSAPPAVQPDDTERKAAADALETADAELSQSRERAETATKAVQRLEGRLADARRDEADAHEQLTQAMRARTAAEQRLRELSR